jgi:hypothetical protein
LPWIVAGVVVVVLLVVGAIAAGMGGEDNTHTADRPDATVTPPRADPDADDTATTAADAGEATDGVPQAARSYFDALASEDLSKMGAMLDASVPGSPAALYATHQIANVRALSPSPLGTTVDVGDDTIALTTTTGYANDGTEQTETNTYGGFALDGAKLTAFTVNDSPVADRIRAGDPAGVTSDGVTARIVTAYVTARGDLFLNVDTTNGHDGALNVASYEWALVTTDGRQVAPSQRFCCPVEPVVQPGATVGSVVVFEQVGLGGTLRYVAFADDFITEARFDVSVPR